MSAYPRARSEGIITEEIDGELVVYDETTKMGHALSKDAVSVWRRCDGHSSLEDIAGRVGLEQPRVARALDELSRAGLIEEPAGISRRALYKRTAKVGAAVLSAPLIYSVAIPPATAHASGTCPIAGFGCFLTWTTSTTCTGTPEDTCKGQSGNNPNCSCQPTTACQSLPGGQSQRTGTCS